MKGWIQTKVERCAFETSASIHCQTNCIHKKIWNQPCNCKTRRARVTLAVLVLTVLVLIRETCSTIHSGTET